MAEAQLHDFPSLFSLEGKVAVVTGGSRGLGLSAASALLQAGASKVFVSSRKASACAAACAALNALPNLRPGAAAIPVPADSATLEGVKHLLQQVSARAEHVDVLLANAGATWGEKFDSHPDAAFAKVMDLNVRGVFNLVREFAPLLGKRASADDPSRVIITASTSGLGVGSLGRQGTYGYSASKAAVIHLARNLAVELGPRGITVNSICPGFFPSKMSNGLLEMAGGVDLMAKANPMRRLGRPEDIAGVVVYLASRAGSHVNGAAIEIDGGALWSGGQLNVSTDHPSAKL
ncbi:Rhamnolipids biosynthesis 3-oxoacyl-[acyl-carrier-protein] reductase [Madurella mycetomatis]|uniref:Rhamnolipids biosynthesis 3-oxoacyl-[acyl-carrier-protein] reductase n=1 Tax=Madurella mycetomatis TaxID=100816 RepID=A0A175W1Q4_9PEZI|nr:Rhamnolipids biosynthesis 3-oxoacyl-[acyl-carrier-protein] reductase [Madurella mycetomatis]